MISDTSLHANNTDRYLTYCLVVHTKHLITPPMLTCQILKNTNDVRQRKTLTIATSDKITMVK